MRWWCGNWVKEIAGLDARAASDDELCSAAVTLAELSSSVTTGLRHVLAELDARGVTDREDGLATGSWLAREAKVPKGWARREVNVARKLRTLADVDDAAVDGRITAHHAAVLADAYTSRVADSLVGLQAELIAEAGELGFEPWRALVRSTAALLDDDGAFDPDEDLARNQLHLVDTIDGITFVDGQLVGEHALTVTQALNAKADELFRRFSADHERCPDLAVPDRKTLLALALVELCRAGFAVDINTTRPPRPEVTLIVGADEPDETTDTRGVKLQDGTTRVLRCDPDLYAVVVDSLGQPIDLGRLVRLATTAQRRALTIRDGWCVFPGCDLPIQWCDAHHVDHFEHGGPTDLSESRSAVSSSSSA